MLEFCPADGPEDLEAARRLFVEYAEELGLDLSFQGFDDELAGLPGRYAPPDGRLVLAREDGRAIGCVALRRIGQDVCEMKRLYVRPEYRGTGVGRRLAERIIDEARAAGYRLMKLDTLSSMAAANRLYESLGFVDARPYGDHSIPGTRCMERSLT